MWFIVITGAIVIVQRHMTTSDTLNLLAPQVIVILRPVQIIVTTLLLDVEYIQHGGKIIYDSTRHSDPILCRSCRAQTNSTNKMTLSFISLIFGCITLWIQKYI